MQHVYWVIDGQLAGRPGPQLHPWIPSELYAGGIRAIVSLHKENNIEDLTVEGFVHHRAAFPPLLLTSKGLQKAFIHEALPIWEFIARQIETGKPTLVHCYAGKDRTGAILAGFLVVYRGLTPEAAIQHLRLLKSDAMEAPGYEAAVRLLHPGQIPDRRTLL
ncbi:MAG: dual specificity protein phosphatase family protein [Anaerolineae bacterium]|nr:dual specificity protein phosphatase family protein [Anaerolineae bacterium]